MKKSRQLLIVFIVTLVVAVIWKLGTVPTDPAPAPTPTPTKTTSEPMPDPEPEKEPEPEPDPEPDPEPEEELAKEEPAKDAAVPGEPTRFLSAIDGDTIKTEAGTVRLIGIDTPERGQCGYQNATKEINSLINHGATIYLELPVGQNSTDRYDRLLRYVYTADGIDVNLLQIEQGHAVARYDSKDGYPYHPKQDLYHEAQIATYASNGSVRPTYCPDVAPIAAPDNPSFGSGWWLEYRSCSHLKKNTVGHPKGPFDVNNPAEVEIYNWFAHGTGYNGDGDGDGLACE